MQYTLNNGFLRENPRICVVGCGGTGGFAAESLCRLLTGYRAKIILVDHDVVEPHNLLRQNFHPRDVGKYKSEALALRLTEKFGRTISYVNKRFQPTGHGRFPGIENHGPGLLIGCVDRADAREAMASWLTGHGNQWLIDAGNGRDWGQVLIGNDPDPGGAGTGFSDGVCNMLPAPTLQRPDLLTDTPETPPDIDCAAAIDLEDQDPAINQTMAALVTEMVFRLIKGSCRFMSLYLDMEQGTLTPNYATPENAARATPRRQTAEASRERTR